MHSFRNHKAAHHISAFPFGITQQGIPRASSPRELSSNRRAKLFLAQTGRSRARRGVSPPNRQLAP